MTHHKTIKTDTVIPQIELQSPSNVQDPIQHPQDDGSINPVFTESVPSENLTKDPLPDAPSTWVQDIFASERQEIQKESTCLGEYENSLQSGITTLPHITEDSCSKLTPPVTAPGRECGQHRHLNNLTAALDASFATSAYNTTSLYSIWSQANQQLQISNENFTREFGLFQYMNMLVPLHSQEAATCSKTDTFEYVPLHVSEPAWDHNISPFDYMLPSPQLKDINDPSVPDHVRKGVAYEEDDIVNFNPEVLLISTFCGEVNIILIIQPAV